MKAADPVSPGQQGSDTATLVVERLSVGYSRYGQRLPAVVDVSFGIGVGEAYGLVGESGCGKTTVALALMRFLPRNATVQGSIRVDGEDVLSLDEPALRAWRGSKVAMVYQDPATALNPVMRVGDQIAEVFRFHGHLSRADAFDRSRDLLDKVAMADPGDVLRRYPHQLSGGQQQRVVIAMALAADPILLILDEPTTGLDATVEAEVLDLIAQLRAELRKSILLITHNLGIVARMCERVAVLYAGRMVEEGASHDVFRAPSHPYTAGLLNCVPTRGATKRNRPLVPIRGSLPALGTVLPGCLFEPRCPVAGEGCRDDEPALIDMNGSARRVRCYYPERAQEVVSTTLPEDRRRQSNVNEGSLLRLVGLHKTYRQGRRRMLAVTEVSLDIGRGEILGLVGESGSGKSTLAKCITGLLELDSGHVELEGLALPGRVAKRDHATLRSLQMVFQNPDATLNPRWRTRSIIRRAGRLLTDLRGNDLDALTLSLAEKVKLERRFLDFRSSELSGGLKQRVAIARAFAGHPSLVVCDEPVSAMDVSIQAAILNLLAELQVKESTSYLFISHDLGVVRYIADRIAVMYLGQVLEVGRSEDIFIGPRHPYTNALLSAVPTLDDAERTRRQHLSGSIPSLADLPRGCPFHTRCPVAIDGLCEDTIPPARVVGQDHVIRCHLPLPELAERQQRGQDERKGGEAEA